MNKISRRDFLKGSVAGALSMTALGVLGGCAEAAAATEATETAAGPETAVETTPAPETEAASAAAEETEAAAAEPEKQNWRIAPAPVDESEIGDSKEADVVIVGLGQSGLACARAAVENGASVIVIEKMAEEVHSWTGGDFGHVNSQWEKEHGIPEVDPVEMLNDWQLKGCNMSNPSLVMKYIKHSGETFDWFINLATEEEKAQIRAFHHPYPTKFTGMQAGQKFWDGTAQFPGIFFEGDFTVTANALKVRDHIMGLGAEIYYANDAQYLEKDESGRVTGVVAKTESGYVRYNAKKGVVLAAGDFSADEDMVAELCPTINALNFKNDGSRIRGFDRDGQGIKMGGWAGGKLEPGPISAMGATFWFPSGVIGSVGILWLDRNYKRFCNEAFGDPVLTGAEAARHKGNVTSIFDADIVEELQYFPSGHGSAFVNDPVYQENLAQMLKDAYEAGVDGVERGLTGTGGAARLFAADTLEELAKYMGLNEEQKETFLASVKQYNEKCEAKYDDDFGKDPEVLFPIQKAPFYGFTREVTAGYEFLCTTGGLWTDNDQNVYDETLETIPGLYATGNCCGRRFGVQYTTPVAGVSVGMAQTLGRLLGEHLAAL